MNRALRNQHAKRCAFRKHGGGYGMGAPLMAMPVDGSFAVTVPVNQSFDDCAFPARPGQLVPIADTSLAQVAMVGGDCGCTAYKRGGARRSRRNIAKRGGCGCTAFKRGGARSTRRTQRGGVFAVDPSVPIGGNGPIAVPAYIAVPCDARAGASAAEFAPDIRAPATLYSLTANQTGGNVSGAPGSQIPVYNADVAGFYFRPSTGTGLASQVGTVPFNEVVPQAARVGGRRKSRKQRKQTKKRKQTKRSRKH